MQGHQRFRPSNQIPQIFVGRGVTVTVSIVSWLSVCCALWPEFDDRKEG